MKAQETSRAAQVKAANITIETLGPGVYTIPQFWEPAACVAFLHEIEASDAMDFEDAGLGRPGAMRLKQVRDNDRIIWDNPTLAASLWEQLSGYDLPTYFGATPIGLNERLRIYRYRKGQKFDWHGDGRFQRPNGEQSLFTFLLYLSDDFVGGETAFRDVKVVPQAGLVCLFEHKREHKGAEVVSGAKYVLRSDVMYTPLFGGRR